MALATLLTSAGSEGPSLFPEHQGILPGQAERVDEQCGGHGRLMSAPV